ncbi:DUF4097 domain-containing protein [Arthrobacter sp. D1-29]
MFNFATPEPISVTIELNLGDVRMTASDRADAVVEVQPTDESKASDIRAAEQTRVEYSHGRLVVKGSSDWRRYAVFTGNGSVDVTIKLPSRSDVRAEAGMGKFECQGELGRCSLKTGMGRIRLDRTASVKAETGYGDITLEGAAGDVEIKTGSGEISARRIEGAAHVKSSDGHVYIGWVAGDVQVKAANGKISIGQAQGSVTAKSANGRIRVGGVARGSVLLETAMGDVRVGVQEGTAAWLDVSTQYGRVLNSLNAADGPGGHKETVEIRARTSYGDVEIQRSLDPIHETGNRG